MILSERTRADVERVLPGAGSSGLTPSEAHAKLGMWSKITVQHALRELAETGRVRFSGEPGRRRYWRAA
jgi:DNA-binding transcriptional regulator GbsR (MarR family)